MKRKAKKPQRDARWDLQARDGTRWGDPIPGSIYFRSFCRICRDPMRVCEADRLKADVNCNCWESPPAGGYGPYDDEDANGSWHNVVRASEE